MKGIALIRHRVVSDDLAYYGHGINALTATEVDNDPIGVTVSARVLAVPEGGSAQYTVVLNTLPTDVVYIDVLSGTGSDTDLLALSKDRTDLLTFEVGKWNVPQTVKVSAAEDTDRPDRHRRLSARGFRDRPDAVSLDRRIRL